MATKVKFLGDWLQFKKGDETTFHNETYLRTLKERDLVEVIEDDDEVKITRRPPKDKMVHTAPAAK